jgi:cytochrome oxidase Cu insertion factor (SCO1/SenC/PrrC family)
LLLFAPKAAEESAAIGGDFSLTDQNGQTVTNESLKGKLRLVYFGFTFCPDICPTALLAMAEAAKQLGNKAPAQIFISVDPERDTVEHLKEYAENFPGLIALTGSAESVKQAARAYKVYYKKNGEDKNYLIDHSGFIYLMDKEGNYLAHFPHNATPDKIVTAIQTNNP